MIVVETPVRATRRAPFLHVYVRAIKFESREIVRLCGLAAILLSIPLRQSYSQNLVPNPGFEQHLNDPESSADGVNEAPHWFRLERTSDFFHAQYDSPNSVPANWRGYQSAGSGEGYAGIIAFTLAAPVNHEFLAVRLTESLMADQIYDISFEVSLSEQSRWGIDALGAVLLQHEPTQEDLDEYQYVVRNQHGHILGDTMAWQTISGQVRAEGGEEYLLIGTLLKDREVSFSEIIDPDIPWAYYFIDNVYLAPCQYQHIVQFELDTVACSGEKIAIQGLEDAINYRWLDGAGVKRDRQVRADGIYVIDNHYDCEVVQQVFQISFSDCGCTIALPTLYNELGFFGMQISPIVQSWSLRMYDASGRIVLSTDEQEGIISEQIPTGSAVYFWTANLSCLDPNENVFHRTVQGKMLVQN